MTRQEIEQKIDELARETHDRKSEQRFTDQAACLKNWIFDGVAPRELEKTEKAFAYPWSPY